MIIKEKDNRLFLQHGPIDIVVEAIGKDKYLAYEKVKTYFKTLLINSFRIRIIKKRSSIQQTIHKSNCSKNATSYSRVSS